MSTVITDHDEHIGFESRQEALESRVLLLCPTIGWWKGMYQLPGKTTETVSDGVTVDKDDVTTPRAKLMTDKYPVDRVGVPWKKRFQKIESRLGALKEEFSVPFPITGVRIVPKSRGKELMDQLYGLTLGRLRERIAKARDDGHYGASRTLEDRLAQVIREEGENAHPNTPIWDPTKEGGMQSIAYELHIAASEFCRDWESIRQQIADKNDVFEQVQSRVPQHGSSMRDKFRLDVVPVELAGGSRSTTLTAHDLEEHSAVVQEACRRRVDEAIETMIQGPRQQLADALAGLHELIDRDGRVTPKSFAPVRAAIAKIRLFDFAANPDLLAQINQLEVRLKITTPSSLDRVTAANNGFTAAIQSFMAEVVDTAAQSRDIAEFGREFRSIDLG